jgi:hypothetical protein
MSESDIRGAAARLIDHDPAYRYAHAGYDYPARLRYGEGALVNAGGLRAGPRSPLDPAKGSPAW